MSLFASIHISPEDLVPSEETTKTLDAKNRQKLISSGTYFPLQHPCL
jgi:hypothetical protein